jgi:hypothetical protein
MFGDATASGSPLARRATGEAPSRPPDTFYPFRARRSTENPDPGRRDELAHLSREQLIDLLVRLEAVS